MPRSATASPVKMTQCISYFHGCLVTCKNSAQYLILNSHCSRGFRIMTQELDFSQTCNFCRKSQVKIAHANKYDFCQNSKNLFFWPFLSLLRNSWLARIFFSKIWICQLFSLYDSLNLWEKNRKNWWAFYCIGNRRANEQTVARMNRVKFIARVSNNKGNNKLAT